MSRVSVVLATLLVMLSCSSISAGFSPDNYNVKCEMYNYWVYVPLPRTLVQSWLPNNVQFGTHPFPTLGNDKWPVLLEFNEPRNCVAKLFPFIETSMLEWKLEVPYLRQSGLAAPLMFKPLTIMDNKANSLLTKYLIYGINAVFPDKMSLNNETNPGTYNITVSGDGMSATFANVAGQESYVPITSASYGAPYITLNDATEWIGYILWFQKCAKIFYQWQDTTVRPVIANIHFDAGFLPNSQQSFDLTSIDGAKAIQIRSFERITGLADCTKTAKTNSVGALDASEVSITTSNNNGANLSTGVVVAIAAASSVVTTLILVAIIAVIRRRQINKHQQSVSHIEATQQV